MSADAPILYDWAGAPVAAANAPITGRPGQALNATAQGGMVILGSDYSTTPTARTPKIDANGSAYTVATNPAGTSNLFYGGQAAPALASQYGSLVMGRMDLPTPSSFYPLTLDQTGALQAHLKSKVTFTVSATAVTLGTNNILLALYNGSSMVLRTNRCMVYIPPAGGSSGALLGSSNGQTYYPVICELRRTTTYTGGTALTPVPSDSADSLSTGITVAKSVTSVAAAGSTFTRADAYATNMTGIPFYERGADPNAKTFVIRPGEGAYLICLSNGTINSTQAGGGTVTGSADIMLTFTQASA